MTNYPPSMIDLTGTGPFAYFHDDCEPAYHCDVAENNSPGGHIFVNLSGPKNWCAMHAAPGRSVTECVCGDVERQE